MLAAGAVFATTVYKPANAELTGQLLKAIFCGNAGSFLALRI